MMVNDEKKMRVDSAGSGSQITGFTQSKRQRRIFLAAILAVPVAHWFVFWLYVNINSIKLAFLTPAGNLSLNNFVQLWDSLTYAGGELNIALKNTFIYFLNGLVVMIPGSIVIAYFIYKRILFHKLFRIIYYLPAIISSVALVAIYKEFVQPWGPVPFVLDKLGISTPAKGLLGDPSTATLTILIYGIWTGFTSNMLLLNGTMSRIPVDVLESARLEGCGPFREIVSIIVPLIWPTISTLIIFAITGLFTASGPILLFTKGAFETTTISYWIFNNVYSVGPGAYNLVSCAGLVFTLAGLPVILGTKWLLERHSNVEY